MKAAPHYGYVQLSNMFWRSAKAFTLVRTNPAALGYFTVLLSWAGDNLSDGMLPSNVVTGLFAVPEDSLKALLAVGFLEEAKDGYQIHDYLDWNRSKSQIEEEAEKKREQTRKRVEKFRSKQKTAKNVEVDSSKAVTLSNAPVTHRKRTTTELQNNRTTKQHIPSFPKSLPSQVPLDQYEPPEDLKKEMMQECKISAAAFALLEEGFRGWWSEQDEQEKTRGQWDRLLKGWIRKSKNRPEYQVHKHTWACEHTLHALGVTSTAELNAQFEEPTRGNQLAQQVAAYLNRGESEDEAVTHAQEQMFD